MRKSEPHTRRVPSLAASAVVMLVVIGVAVGCAGKDGDPAPPVQEAGPGTLVPCTDAGATE